MVGSKKVLVALALFVAALSGIGAYNGQNSAIIVDTESGVKPEAATTTISTTPGNARLMIDGLIPAYSGWTGILKPGPHLIAASAPDHYPAQFPFFVQENTKYSIKIKLDPHEGYLSIDVSPEDAEVYVDGSRVSGKFAELPVGRHSVKVRKFGFDEAIVPISIQWFRTSTLRVALSPSVFEVRSLKARPARFNPSNKGLYGRAAITFTVTAPGTGRLELLDAKGKVAYAETLPAFRTWSQRSTWDGVDTAGARVADGVYRARLTLAPLPLEEGAAPFGAKRDEPRPIVAETTLNVDSSLKVSPSGYLSARPGLTYFADPGVPGLLPGGIEASLSLPDGSFELALGFSAGESTRLAFQAALCQGEEGAAAFGFSSRIGAFGALDAGVFGRAAWRSAGGIAYPGAASELELSLPLAVGGGSFRLGLAPGLVYDFETQALAARASAGIGYRSAGLYAGVSAQCDLGAAAPASAANPVHAAAEARALFDGLPFVLSFRMTASFAPTFGDGAAGIGFGVAW
ncbi:hypothetical protein LWX53_08180 [bacterium]|nr:hypothetical protein [bacterium]